MSEIVRIKETYNHDNNSVTRIEHYDDSTVWLMGISVYDDIIDIHAHNFDIDHAPSNISFIINNNDTMYMPFSNLVDKYNGYKEMLDPYYNENKKRIIFSKNENNDIIISFYNDKLNYDPDNEYGDYGYKFSIIYYKHQDTEDKTSLLNLFEDLKNSFKNNKVKKIEPIK